MKMFADAIQFERTGRHLRSTQFLSSIPATAAAVILRSFIWQYDFSDGQSDAHNLLHADLDRGENLAPGGQ